jgi:Na+-transporting methylmalonyl-CoA/oxaloacetate decarboxylase gamma subunit
LKPPDSKYASRETHFQCFHKSSGLVQGGCETRVEVVMGLFFLVFHQLAAKRRVVVLEWKRCVSRARALSPGVLPSELIMRLSCLLTEGASMVAIFLSVLIVFCKCSQLMVRGRRQKIGVSFRESIWQMQVQAQEVRARESGVAKAQYTRAGYTEQTGCQHLVILTASKEQYPTPHGATQNNPTQKSG